MNNKRTNRQKPAQSVEESNRPRRRKRRIENAVQDELRTSKSRPKRTRRKRTYDADRVIYLAMSPSTARALSELLEQVRSDSTEIRAIERELEDQLS